MPNSGVGEDFYYYYECDSPGTVFTILCCFPVQRDLEDLIRSPRTGPLDKLALRTTGQCGRALVIEGSEAYLKFVISSEIGLFWKVLPFCFPVSVVGFW